MIDVGESATNGFVVDGSDTHNIYLCEWCAENFNEILYKNGEDEFSQGDLHEWITHYIDDTCQQCNDSGNVNYETDTRKGVIKFKCDGVHSDKFPEEPCGYEWKATIKEVLCIE
jgi:hypothetical protein